MNYTTYFPFKLTVWPHLNRTPVLCRFHESFFSAFGWLREIEYWKIVFSDQHLGMILKKTNIHLFNIFTLALDGILTWGLVTLPLGSLTTTKVTGRDTSHIITRSTYTDKITGCLLVKNAMVVKWLVTTYIKIENFGHLFENKNLKMRSSKNIYLSQGFFLSVWWNFQFLFYWETPS